MNEYEPLEIIGKGSFGTVRKVRNKLTHEIAVRKEIEYKSMNSHERNQIISELRILKELNNKNIVRYYKHDHIIAQKCIHIYMEYCSGGDLAKYINATRARNDEVPEEFIWQVLVQMLCALYRCHYGSDAEKVNLFSQGGSSSPKSNRNGPKINSDSVIIHRDIKPDNIFLQDNVFKLGDFGLAKMLTTQNDFAKTYVGTPYYMSPEVLMDEPYSPVCDIWSLGCVLYELCNLVPPFQAKTHLQLQSKIRRGVIPNLAEGYSIQLRTLIKECITVDPELRPTCYDLINTLSVKFLRKEMELNEYNRTLTSLKYELINKSEELKKKEQFLQVQESKLKEKELGIVQMENSLIGEFNLKKQALDLEAKEVRLGYQKEFWTVVEKEVEKQLEKQSEKQIEKRVQERINSRPRGPRPLDDMRSASSSSGDDIVLRNKNLNVAATYGEPNLTAQFASPKFRVTDEYERQRNTEVRKYRIN
ncbi:G2-specific serine/threonine protein kinase [Lodderomyces elongisporus]|uniref:G2-specific serine/threonine protein kinase n=1 Tax=Lodderomyces elongisporus TaxID=36914 RepID=UPI002924FED8|nr:G2-specific serine/threonine protein kinase [Lodderomyces elongisporus]WLF80668.1 G2-specific serine/threonine protein kinase [Lodderomyces elongisporus]